MVLMALNTIDTSQSKLRNTYIAVLIPLGIAINYVGGLIAEVLSLPIYLDSIGTVIVAVIGGPWVGAISGVLYNIVSSLIGGNVLASLFGLCNLGTALIVGYLARAGKFKTVTHIVIATILVALLNAIIGTPIGLVVYGGVDGNASTNLLIAGLQATGSDLLSAAFIGRLPSQLLDKGIAVVISWLIYWRLPDNLRVLNASKSGSESAVAE
jgi:energy-coupling factor transport system substrate-specific component